MNIYHLTLLIRNRIKLDKHQALYIFINGKDLMKSDTSIRELYDRHKDQDGFVYINYYEQSSFGYHLI